MTNSDGSHLSYGNDTDPIVSWDNGDVKNPCMNRNTTFRNRQDMVTICGDVNSSKVTTWLPRNRNDEVSVTDDFDTTDSVLLEDDRNKHGRDSSSQPTVDIGAIVIRPCQHMPHNKMTSPPEPDRPSCNCSDTEQKTRYSMGGNDGLAFAVTYLAFASSLIDPLVCILVSRDFWSAFKTLVGIRRRQLVREAIEAFSHAAGSGYGEGHHVGHGLNWLTGQGRDRFLSSDSGMNSLDARDWNIFREKWDELSSTAEMTETLAERHKE